MKSTKYLLIGGGLAASQAAKQLREQDPQGSITLVGEEPYVPYDRPPLSKEFLRGEKLRHELFFDPEPYFRDQKAEYCGQLAGQNMAGAKNKYDLLTYVWSDIFDLHLEFAGDESEQDQTLLRGRFQDKSFTVLYLKQKVLRAYFAVNTGSKEFPILQRLIRLKKDLAGKEAQLQDPTFAIEGFV